MNEEDQIAALRAEVVELNLKLSAAKEREKALGTALTKMTEEKAGWEMALETVVDALKLNHERAAERLRAVLEEREGKA